MRVGLNATTQSENGITFLSNQKMDLRIGHMLKLILSCILISISFIDCNTKSSNEFEGSIYYSQSTDAFSIHSFEALGIYKLYSASLAGKLEWFGTWQESKNSITVKIDSVFSHFGKEDRLIGESYYCVLKKDIFDETCQIQFGEKIYSETERYIELEERIKTWPKYLDKPK